MAALALTDRDGLYGAVKFAQACQAAGIAPMLGRRPRGGAELSPAAGRADPACAPAGRRTPVRGGAERRPPPPAGHRARPRPGRRQRPARRRRAGGGCAGWSRPPTCAASAGPRSATSTWSPSTRRPARDGRAGAGRAARPGLRVGRAALARAPGPGPGRRWPAGGRLLPPGSLAVEVVCHHGPAGDPGQPRPRRPDARARPRAPACPPCSPTPSATPTPRRRGDRRRPRRRPPAGRRSTRRHLDRVTAEGYLAPAEHMAAGRPGGRPGRRGGPESQARRPARRHRGPGPAVPARPRAPTSASARCTSPRPRGARAGRPARTSDARAAQALRGRDRPTATRGAGAELRRAIEQRLDDELADDRHARLRRRTSSPSPRSST